MAGNLITATPKSSMHALAFQGIMVYTCFSQIRDMLGRKFGDEYVLLFAMPVENALDGRIDWYSPVQGQARRLRELPENERAPVLRNIATMAGEILKYADELAASRDPLKVTRGSILKLALSYPDDDALFVVGGQPVFTCWGFGPGTPGVEGKNLWRIQEPRPARAEPVQPGESVPPVAERSAVRPDRKKFLWLPWLLPLLLLLLLLALLFGAFGSLGSLTGHAFFQLPDFLAVPDYSGEIDSLRDENARLENDLEKHSAMCVPARPAVPPAPVAQPEEKLVIPEHAENAGFLAGEWLCETGLGNARTGEPVKVIFSFDKSGRGMGKTIERNDECEGDARAEMVGNALRITLSTQQCKKNPGTSYLPVAIECKSAMNASTVCEGSNTDGSKWDATFIKIR